MPGIIATGIHIPVYRLPRDTIAQAWGRGSLGGERAVANGDEDSLTMAVAAGMDCLAGADRSKVDAVYFASTTAPYREKQTASLLAAALDLPEEITTIDFANSLRAGTQALRAAFQAVAAGAARAVLVAAADCRLGYPRSEQEQSFGDGAAAVLVSAESGGATIEATYSRADAIMDVWRKADDTYVRTWEERWVSGEGWTENVRQALAAVLERAQLSLGTVDKIVFAGGSAVAQARLAKGLAIPAEKLQDNFARTIGDTGAAHALLGLCASLQATPPGGHNVVTSYGDGADAIVIRAGDTPPYAGRHAIGEQLSARMTLPTYQRYLAARNLVEIVPGEPFRLNPSATVTWREESSIMRCRGSRCRECGTVAYPIQRVCYSCRSKDQYDEVRLSGDRGTVFTYSIDHLAGRGDDPVLVQTVAELDDTKARFYGLMADCDPFKVRIGMPVELTFRRLYEGAGFYNYFWKCCPVRGRGE